MLMGMFLSGTIHIQMLNQNQKNERKTIIIPGNNSSELGVTIDSVGTLKETEKEMKVSELSKAHSNLLKKDIFNGAGRKENLTKERLLSINTYVTVIKQC